MSEREFIFNSSSPICEIDAVIAAEENSYYLYFTSSPEFEMRILNALWICNRHETPDKTDYMSALEKNEGPTLSKENVSEMQPIHGMEFNPDKFSCVWYDTGDAAAIFYDKKLICVIPPIVGLYDFPGFSVFAKGQTHYAWEMPKDPEFEKQIMDNKLFWEMIKNENTWKKLEQDYLEAIDTFIGSPCTNKKSIGIEKFPNRAIVQGNKDSKLYSITIGVSLYAMPSVAKVFGNNCKDQSRIEFGFSAISSHSKLTDIMDMVMSDVADIPWKERSFFWHGHTITFNYIIKFVAILFINPIYVEGMESPQWQKISGCKVNTLWLVPITATELKYLRDHGIDELIKKSDHPKSLHIFDGKPKFIQQ